MAQSQRIDVDDERVLFTFGPVHETMRQQVEKKREWLESVAASVAGRKVAVMTAKGAAAPEPMPAPPAGNGVPPRGTPREDPGLKARALADSAVQAMLEVFPAEIRDVEEIE